MQLFQSKVGKKILYNYVKGRAKKYQTGADRGSCLIFDILFGSMFRKTDHLSEVAAPLYAIKRHPRYTTSKTYTNIDGGILLNIQKKWRHSWLLTMLLFTLCVF